MRRGGRHDKWSGSAGRGGRAGGGGGAARGGGAGGSGGTGRRGGCPFLALVVSVQPMGYVTFYTLGVTVRRTSSSGGACAVVAFTLFGAATLRVGSVGPSLSLHLALFVTILPRKTRAVV